MKHFVLIAASAVFAALPSIVRAQDVPGTPVITADSVPVSLQDAIARAIGQSQEVRLARAQVRLAEAQVGIAGRDARRDQPVRGEMRMRSGESIAG